MWEPSPTVSASSCPFTPPVRACCGSRATSETRGPQGPGQLQLCCSDAAPKTPSAFTQSRENYVHLWRKRHFPPTSSFQTLCVLGMSHCGPTAAVPVLPQCESSPVSSRPPRALLLIRSLCGRAAKLRPFSCSSEGQGRLQGGTGEVLGTCCSSSSSDTTKLLSFLASVAPADGHKKQVLPSQGQGKGCLSGQG